METAAQPCSWNSLAALRNQKVSASGSPSLMPRTEVILMAGLSQWGAYFASQLDLDLAAVIVVDMVGDANLEIYQEANSDRALTESIWRLAQELGLSKYFIPQVKYSIIDDHLPFASRGIPSALLIDFDYPYWHTSDDTPDKVSPKSLEIVGSVLKAWVEKEGKRWTEKR